MARNPKPRRREWRGLAAWMRRDVFKREARNPRKHGLAERYWPETAKPRTGWRLGAGYGLSACFILPTFDPADWTPPPPTQIPGAP